MLTKNIHPFHKQDERVLVGPENSDDASVFKLNDNTCLVSTVDMITPLINDAYIYGQVCAANSLSDIYAMGAKPLYALNVVSIPAELDDHLVEQMYQGAKDIVDRAGISIVGGHSVSQDVLLYGLSVTGQVSCDKYFANDMAKADCAIYISKPIGVGIYSACYKDNLLSEKQFESWHQTMTVLNDKIANIAIDFVSTMTDITGFGLLGHAYEVCSASNITAIIDYDKVEFFDQCQEFFDKGYKTGAGQRNLEHISQHVSGDFEKLEMLCDPQTSGGLLMFVKLSDCEAFEQACALQNQPVYCIGKTTERTGDIIEVK